MRYITRYNSTNKNLYTQYTGTEKRQKSRVSRFIYKKALALDDQANEKKNT